MAERFHPQPCRLARALTWTMIGLTAAIGLFWSHAKLFSQDEMYEFQTDSVPSLHDLIGVQLHWPISLDPLVYHSLSHLAMQVAGRNAFAQRLPALLGFLLMQGCLFFLVRGLAGERAGAVAATFPALTATLFYAVEGRPYGLLLGLYALALLCWVYAADRETGRMPALAGLALSIALTVNTHYFGVLLLLPLFAAELWRTVGRRKLDAPMLSSLAIGCACIVFTRPFARAAGEFRQHYYNAGSLSLHDITRGYRSLLVNYTTMSVAAQRGWVVALCLFAAALVFGCWRASHRPAVALRSAHWVLLLTLAALPFGGYLLALFVTHAFEVRYVLGAIIAISALAAVALADRLDSDAFFSALMACLGLVLVIGGVIRIHSAQADARQRLASLTLPPTAEQFLRDHPGSRLFVQNMGTFEEDRYYIPDPDIQSRMTLVFSADEELRWNRHDTMALTAIHLQRFTSLPVASYESVRSQTAPQLFLLRHTGWDWTDQALAADHAEVQILGRAFDGDLALVRFRQAAP